eukprot:TCONS_00039306-protein
MMEGGRKDTTTTDKIKFIALNCSGYKANSAYVDSLTNTYDCLFLNELWITKTEEHLLNHYKNKFKTIFQPAKKSNTGRPSGGTVLLLSKQAFHNTVTIIQEDFLTTVKLSSTTLKFLSPEYIFNQPQNTECTDIYRSQLATLTGITEQFSESCETIILGDFQSYPKVQKTTRFAQQNRLSKYLIEFIEDNELNPIDITKGEGPTYTYHHISLPNRSYIDNILTSNELTSNAYETKVLEPSASNTSDHLPVTTTLNIQCSVPAQQSTNPNESNQQFQLPNYIWHNNHFISIYQNKVTTAIQQLEATNDVETDLTNLNELLLQCSSDSYANLKNNKFHFQPKK